MPSEQQQIQKNLKVEKTRHQTLYCGFTLRSRNFLAEGIWKRSCTRRRRGKNSTKSRARCRKIWHAALVKWYSEVPCFAGASRQSIPAKQQAKFLRGRALTPCHPRASSSQMKQPTYYDLNPDTRPCKRSAFFCSSFAKNAFVPSGLCLQLYSALLCAGPDPKGDHFRLTCNCCIVGLVHIGDCS